MPLFEVGRLPPPSSPDICQKGIITNNLTLLKSKEKGPKGDGTARDGGPVVRGSDCFGLDRGDNVNFGVKGEK